MEKYWLIIKNTWDEYAVYRLNFILWRVRSLVRFASIYFLWWSVVTLNQGAIGHYVGNQLLTYFFLAYIIGSFVFATRTTDIGMDINDGKLTNMLLKPLSYFTYLAARDISDKLINLLFTIGEVLLLVYFLQPPFFIQSSPILLLLFCVYFLGSIILYFFLSTLLGLAGFWTIEIWSIRFIFSILLDFLAGSFVPIDLLPQTVRAFLGFTPFPFVLYYPIKIYLGDVSVSQIIQDLPVMGMWVLVLYFCIHIVWKQGLKVYSAEGR